MSRYLKVNRERLRALWTADVRTADIAAALGMSPSSVSRLARRLGLPCRQQGGWGATRSRARRDHTALRDEVARRYAAGEAQNTIARGLGIANYAVAAIERALGLTRRVGGGRRPR